MGETGESGKSWYATPVITGQDGFAFDHAKIIACVLLNLQQQAEKDESNTFLQRRVYR